MTEAKEGPWPPEPFNPPTFTLAEGTTMYRVFKNDYKATVFNPNGKPGKARFSTFSNPDVVPVLYAASTQEAAVCETIFNRFMAGDEIAPSEYRSTVMARISPTRDLRLAKFMGPELKSLGLAGARELTDTDSGEYPRTNEWAKAAHTAGFEGIVWMSSKANDSQAYVLFGDRVATTDLVQDMTFGMSFASQVDSNWLTDFGARCGLHVLDTEAPIPSS